MDAASLMENGTDSLANQEKEAPDFGGEQAEEELPEDEDAVREIADNIAKKLDASLEISSNGKAVTEQ